MWFTESFADSPSPHACLKTQALDITQTPSPTPQGYTAAVIQAHWYTSQSIDKGGTGRVNKELEVQQGK